MHIPLLVLLLVVGFNISPDRAYAGLIDRAQDKISNTIKGFFKSSGIEVDWKEISFDFDPDGLTTLNVSAQSKNLAISLPESGVEAAIESLHIKVKLKVGLDGLSVLEIGPARALGVVARVAPKEKAKDPNEAFLELPVLPNFELPGIIAGANIKDVELVLQSLSLKGEGGETVLTAKVLSGAADELRFEASVKGQEIGAKTDISFKFLRQKGAIAKVTADGSYDAKVKGTVIRGPLSMSVGPNYLFETSPKFVFSDKSTQQINAKALIAQGRSGTAGSTAKVTLFSEVPPDATNNAVKGDIDCTIEANWTAAPRQSVDLATQCAAKATPYEMPLKKQLPKSWSAVIAATVKIARADVPNPKFSTQISVTSPKTVGTAITSRFDVKARVSGRLTERPEFWRIDPSGNYELHIIDFQTLVGSLADTPAAIPASLNMLAGNVKISGSLNKQGNGLGSKTSVVTNLKSAEQDLNLKLQALVKLDHITSPKVIDIDANLDLAKVRIHLPDILLESPPQLVSDGRFVSKEKLAVVGPEQPGPKVNYRIRVTNPKSTPIQLVSNMALQPIPFHLEADIKNDEPMKLKVLVQTFAINLFKRDAVVENFNVKIRDDDEIADIDGKISIDYADYKILVGISGTAAHTIYKMQSEPPLPERDIYAVLLFGEPMTSVDKGDASSAASLQSAAASGAVALTSMYYLASSPIESVHYNPVTESISAKVRIGKGTSMSVGREGAKTSRVGIRRKLWGNWFAHTYVDRDDTSGENKGAGFLEWSYSY